jgi:hypothetical protein
VNLVSVARTGAEVILFLLGWRFLQILIRNRYPQWAGAMSVLV